MDPAPEAFAAAWRASLRRAGADVYGHDPVEAEALRVRVQILVQPVGLAEMRRILLEVFDVCWGFAVPFPRTRAEAVKAIVRELLADQCGCCLRFGHSADDCPDEE